MKWSLEPSSAPSGNKLCKKHNVFRVRYLESTSILENIAMTNYIVHRSSPIIDLLVTEGNALIYDIESNFVLAPIQTCLEAIKRKTVSFLLISSWFRLHL